MASWSYWFIIEVKKQVMNKPFTNKIDISQLEKGVYILQLSDGQKLTTQRIIKN